MKIRDIFLSLTHKKRKENRSRFMQKKTAQSLIRDIKRKTNRTYSLEEKIRIVIEGRL